METHLGNNNTSSTQSGASVSSDADGLGLGFQPVKTYYDKAEKKPRSVRPYENGVDGLMTGEAIDYDPKGNILTKGIFNHSTFPSELYQFDLNRDVKRAAFFDEVSHKKIREEEYLDGGEEKLVHTYGTSMSLRTHFEHLFPGATKIVFDTVTRHKLKTQLRKKKYSLDNKYKQVGKEWLVVTVFRGKFPSFEYEFDNRGKLTRASFFDDKGKKTKDEIYEYIGCKKALRKIVYLYDVVNPYDDDPSKRASDDKQPLYDVKMSCKRWSQKKIRNYEPIYMDFIEMASRQIFYAEPKQSPNPTDLAHEKKAGEIPFKNGKRFGILKQWYKNGNPFKEIEVDGRRNLSLKVWAPDEPVMLKNVRFGRDGTTSGWVARYNRETGRYERHSFGKTATPANSDDFYTKKTEVTRLGITEQPSARETPAGVLASDGLEVCCMGLKLSTNVPILTLPIAVKDNHRQYR